ncbi:hypothetical protein GKQ23_01175 (plasmid) [Erwinia sp. E602]|uniref:putative T6SS immunity periplasmic lipoprotein n=1 Tax=Erwinia sp. E602 TaxID=2675378 RepID=UPI001BAB6154|nr:putative T6SS immunity periplasmic lipoprotein [Erwinia sp. E602]QUG73686.1 hypothetical protein GKQ23_01175 [Erwinia sp. E602]
MKLSLFTVTPLIFLLTGCPGEGDRLIYNHWRSIYLSPEKVCFSVDKKDVLKKYSLEYIKKISSESVLESGYGNPGLSYPETCFDIKLKTGYKYYAYYILNDTKYRYVFFIDNNWNVFSMQRSL